MDVEEAENEKESEGEREDGTERGSWRVPMCRYRRLYRPVPCYIEKPHSLSCPLFSSPSVPYSPRLALRQQTFKLYSSLPSLFFASSASPCIFSRPLASLSNDDADPLPLREFRVLIIPVGLLCPLMLRRASRGARERKLPRGNSL